MRFVTPYPITTLGEIISETQYGTSKPATSDPCRYPVLRMNNITADGAFALDDLKWIDLPDSDIDRYTVKPGDLLFNRTNSRELVGKTAVWKKDEPFAYAGYLIRARFQPSKAIPEYVSAFLNSHIGKTLLYSRAKPSINMANISATDLRRFPIPLPPLAEQKRIADILDKADAIRRKRQEAVETFSHLAISLFHYQFGDPSHNPFAWKMGTLKDLIHEATDGPHVSPKYSDGGIPFLSTRNVRPGRLIWEDIKYISREEAAIQWRKCKPEFGDILYTKGGTTGFAKAVDFHEEIAVWVHVALLKTNHEQANPLWLETMLNTPYCYRQSQRFTRGIVNRDLGLTRMVNIKLFIPPIKEQDRFADRLSRLGRSQDRYGRAQIGSDEVFQSLVHRAFRGEL